MYANTVDFGSNAFGIKTAAKTYFGTTPKHMTTEQAAILVGLLKATTYYNPRINPKNALGRRNVVLDNMRTHGHLTPEACDSLKQTEIKLDYSVENAYDGEANYFREAVADWMKQWCKEYYGDDRAYAYYTEGLKIHTTLDLRMQHYAEEAAVKQMKEVQKTFNQHWGNVNPWQDERHIEIPHFIEDIAKKFIFIAIEVFRRHLLHRGRKSCESLLRLAEILSDAFHRKRHVFHKNNIVCRKVLKQRNFCVGTCGGGFVFYVGDDADGVLFLDG
jgi:membrane carboxypeptidase/penicillin-binding protein